MTEQECGICKMISSQNQFMVYEDENFFVMQHPLPSVKGHLILLPKPHYTVLYDVPPQILGKAFIVANAFSTILFDAFKAAGTNILVQNGVPAGQSQHHFMIHIIPRTQDDNLSLSWEPKEATPDELSTAEAKLRPHVEIVSSKTKEIPVIVHKENVQEISTANKDDYRLRQLRRIP